MGDMGSSSAGVSRWVWTFCLNETTQEINQLIPILIDPAQKPLFVIVHDQSPFYCQKFRKQIIKRYNSPRSKTVQGTKSAYQKVWAYLPLSGNKRGRGICVEGNFCFRSFLPLFTPFYCL
jgi:hypothetical protein